MIRVLSVDNMRRSDAAAIVAGVPGRELMLRAGQGVFSSTNWKPPVAILCGSGNNAGDGYVIAKLLHEAGIRCVLIQLSGKCSEDGAYYLAQCRKSGIPILPWDSSMNLAGYGTIVDCIFGTGFRGDVRGAAREAVEAVNRSGTYVVSVDINSGLNGDSGLAELCVRSDLTVSVGSYKPGHFLNMAKDVMKHKINCDIGIEPVDKTYSLLEATDLKHLFRPRDNYSHKGTYGYTALIGGSKKYSGAIRLAGIAAAAMRSGAGVVKLAVPDFLFSVVAPAVLESTVFPLSDDGDGIVFQEMEIRELVSNVKTVAFGMGVGTAEGAAEVLDYLLSHYTGRLIIDADGLTLLSRINKNRIREATGTLVLTPHVKEFSRLTGLRPEEILNSPVAAAETYAKENRVILLLKGPATVITDGESTCLTDTGCAGMATAGSGDVLSGILAAVLCCAPDPLYGAAAAAWVNGKAGETAQSRTGSVSMTAGDTAGCIAEVIRRISE